MTLLLAATMASLAVAISASFTSISYATTRGLATAHLITGYSRFAAVSTAAVITIF